MGSKLLPFENEYSLFVVNERECIGRMCCARQEAWRNTLKFFPADMHERDMFNLENMRPGMDYALIGGDPDTECYPLFTGVAGYIVDDFIAAGVILSRLQKDEFLAIAL